MNENNIKVTGTWDDEKIWREKEFCDKYKVNLNLSNIEIPENNPDFDKELGDILAKF